MDQKKKNVKNESGFNFEGRRLLKELRGYEREGTQLYLNDRQCRADEIVRACMVAEDSGYMRDFVGDEHAHITEIHFIRLSE